MIIWESIKLSLLAIWANKVRSFLTMLGMVIGVSSVVTLMAMGQGVLRDVKSTIQGLGTNIIFILPGNIEAAATGSGSANVNPASFISGDILNLSDVAQIQSNSNVEAAVPMSLVASPLKRGSVSASATVTGSDPAVAKIIQGLIIDRGRFIEPADAGKNVIVLGELPAKQLFNSEDPVGQSVQLGTGDFEVIGTIKQKSEASSIFSSDLSTVTIIPFDIATRLNKDRTLIYRIGVKVKPDADVKTVADEIRQSLKTNHPNDDLSAITQDDIVGLMSTVLKLVTAFISGIASISLIVGGVGIMNIMLVSVTERTREIGIRKAVGATQAAILWQFLIEATALTLVGGALGVTISAIVSLIVDRYSPVHPVITWQSIFLAAGISIAVGIVFGLAPAIRAARKDPIEALRWE